MNITKALEIVLQHCDQTFDGSDWTDKGKKELLSAMLRLDRKLKPLLRKRLLRSG